MPLAAHTDSVGNVSECTLGGYNETRRTLEEVVELADTRRDTEVDGLVAEVHNNTAEDRRVNLRKLFVGTRTAHIYTGNRDIPCS